MLIYANALYLEPAGGTGDVIRQVAKWVGQRTRSRVDEACLPAEKMLVVGHCGKHLNF